MVKIQRPGIRRRVAADLQILKRGAQIVELAKLGRRLSAQDVVADFADNLAEELDFRLEAQSMDAWVSHMHASPLGKNIRVPQVYWDLTSERVLTMERIQGIRIDDAAAIRKAGFDGTELVKALLFSVFEGGLRHGLFHGDLHAGNLYVDPDGKIVFFDFGIMGRIDPRTRWLLRELVYALLVTKDHAAAGKIVVLMGAVGTVKPEAEAAKDLEKFATPLTMTSLGDMSYAEIGKQLSTLADAYDVKLPRELVLIGKQFLYVERYMKLLAPKWQMMSDPQLTGYFANFMVEVSREHKDPEEDRGRRLVQIRTGTASSGDLDIYYEDMGDPNDPAVLLIMGLGAQLLLWRKEFCEKLVDQGLRVIRYDNRDVGLSTKVTGRHTGAPLVPRMVRSFLGLRSPAVYTLEDVADDAAALLDHLKIDTAHIVGASMGGMIAQVFAARHQVRTKTLAIIFSSNNQAAAAAAGPQTTAGHPAAAQGRDTRGDHRQRRPGQRESSAAPAIPAPEERIRAEAIEGYDRAYYPAGVGRHFAAVLGSGSLLRYDRQISVADRGDPRQGRQADAAVRRTRHRPRHQGRAAGAVRRHGPRPAPRAVGRHRRRAEDHLRSGWLTAGRPLQFGRGHFARSIRGSSASGLAMPSIGDAAGAAERQKGTEDYGCRANCNLISRTSRRTTTCPTSSSGCCWTRPRPTAAPTSSATT